MIMIMMMMIMIIVIMMIMIMMMIPLCKHMTSHLKQKTIHPSVCPGVDKQVTNLLPNSTLSPSDTLISDTAPEVFEITDKHGNIAFNLPEPVI
jgi:hypothetical protein